MEAKTASATYTTMNELVLPNDTNTHGDLMGGKLMYWMDIAAYLSAAKHCNSAAMTASVDNISFKTPIKLGNVICIEAKVTRAFTTSMEIHLKVWNQNIIAQTRVLSNEAYFTFVALDDKKQPMKVPEIIAETERNRARHWTNRFWKDHNSGRVDPLCENRPQATGVHRIQQGNRKDSPEQGGSVLPVWDHAFPRIRAGQGAVWRCCPGELEIR